MAGTDTCSYFCKVRSTVLGLRPALVTTAPCKSLVPASRQSDTTFSKESSTDKESGTNCHWYKMERLTKEPMAHSTKLARWLRWYKNPPAMQETWIQLGRSAGGGQGNPLQYSCLENPMDRGVWRATVHGVTKSLTRLSDQHFQHKNVLG